jgi:prophage antirepressor-like protein
MDQHSIASKRLMDQVIRSRSSYISSSSGASSRLPPANELEWMHTHTVQNPQLLAQNKKRAAAERAAIQQKIKNDITKSQMEAKKTKRKP